MPAKRAAAKKKGLHELTREEACSVLQVAPTADEELITQAYWHLARKYQASAKRDKKARERLDELNQAFLVLNPGRSEPPDEEEVRNGGHPPEPDPLSEIWRWLKKLSAQTQTRWSGRLLELGTLAIAITILVVLAFPTSVLGTLLGAAIAIVGIWAPWRRTS
jgi:hypothetical protein